MLDIEYKNKDIEKAANDYSVARRKYGEIRAELLHKRIDQIHAADSVAMMVQCRIGRCHPLSQDRKGTYALDLDQPYRLIIEETEASIQIVRVLEITNYHD